MDDDDLGLRIAVRQNRLHYGVTKMADDNRPEAKLPQSLDKDFLIEKCSGRSSVEKLVTGRQQMEAITDQVRKP